MCVACWSLCAFLWSRTATQGLALNGLQSLAAPVPFEFLRCPCCGFRRIVQSLTQSGMLVFNLFGTRIQSKQLRRSSNSARSAHRARQPSTHTWRLFALLGGFQRRSFGASG